jgi:hypothetical protein
MRFDHQETASMYICFESGIRCLFDPRIPDPGWVKKSRSGSSIGDEHPGSYFRELRNNFLGSKCLNSLMRIRTQDPEIFFTLDLGSGIRDGKIRIWDLGYTSWIRNIACSRIINSLQTEPMQNNRNLRISTRKFEKRKKRSRDTVI